MTTITILTRRNVSRERQTVASRRLLLPLAGWCVAVIAGCAEMESGPLGPAETTSPAISASAAPAPTTSSDTEGSQGSGPADADAVNATSRADSTPTPASSGATLSAADTAEIAQLTTYAAQLEAALKAMEEAHPGPSSPTTQPQPLPTVEELMEPVNRGDGAAFSAALEHLVRGGQKEFVRMTEFFKQTEIDRPKIDAITHHPQLIFAVLRVAALYPDETAKYSRHLLAATKSEPESWIRRELYNFLPVFINHHEGRYPELRRDFEADIIDQIGFGATYLYKMSLAMRDLNFYPPAELFYPILKDESKRPIHGLTLNILLQRGEEALPVLRRYLEDSENFNSGSIGPIVSTLHNIERNLGKPTTVKALLDHEAPSLRRTALFVYFNEERDADEVPRIVDHLNSETSPFAEKQRLISVVGRRSPALLDLLCAQSEEDIPHPAIREALLKTQAAAARREARRQAREAKKADAQEGGADGKKSSKLASPNAAAEDTSDADAQDASESGSRPTLIDTLAPEVARLRRRVSDLEIALARKRNQVPLEGWVRTINARTAGAEATPGRGDAAVVARLMQSFHRLDGPALNRDIGQLLAQGEASHATLYDFLHELEQGRREARSLGYNYALSYSLSHLAVLHADNLAKFAHYVFAAPLGDKSSARRLLLDFVPVLVRFHRGRYSGLEHALKEEIRTRLTERRGDLQVYYGMMMTLGYNPPIEVFDRLLATASTHVEIRPIVHHLEARNSVEAIEMLREAVRRTPVSRGWKASIFLGSLGQMTAPEASEALLQLASGRSPHRGAALHAYLASPRDTSCLPLLFVFLTSDAPAREKLQIAQRLKSQPELLAALRTRETELPADVRQALGE